jgi:hypothetical protein
MLRPNGVRKSARDSRRRWARYELGRARRQIGVRQTELNHRTEGRKREAKTKGEWWYILTLGKRRGYQCSTIFAKSKTTLTDYIYTKAMPQAACAIRRPNKTPNHVVSNASSALAAFSRTSSADPKASLGRVVIWQDRAHDNVVPRRENLNGNGDS